MKRKTTFAAVLLLVAFLFGLIPATPVAAVTTCDWAQFVADVSIRDGTVITAGGVFDKTWRLKNIGSCAWSKDYSLVFVNGQQMGPNTTLKLPNSVAPGATVDLTVNLTAPTAAGKYLGNWQLKNASGAQFGIGATANKSFWVKIEVGGGNPGGTGYDFVAEAANAIWTSGAGGLTFGTDGDSKGFAKKLDSPKLENGTTDTAPGLLTVPQNTYNGYIQGQFPAFKVQSGDRFQSIFNCEYNATSCYVNFRLNYQIGSGPVQTFWAFNERYEGLYYRANLDLSSLAGQEVKFILFVGAAGYATGDRALWGAPRITRGGISPTVTPVVTGTPPTPIATNTPNPGTSTCRATFVADINYPDGAAVAPSTAFTKTWRIKNTGTCTWTTSYSLVYVSGEKMGGTDVALKSTVSPNTSFDISVNLTSPAANGTYRGYWQLKDDKGKVFGIGANGDKPWWVEIVVNAGVTATPPLTATPPPPGSVAFDFTTDPGAAIWTSGSGALTFGGTDPSDSGFAQKLTSVKLEDGSTDTRPSLIMVPQNITTDGYIKAVYPAFSVQSNDHFKATIGCQFGANSCFVTYKVEYQVGSDPVVVLNTYSERFDGLTRNIDINLSALAGKNAKFILTIVTANGTTGSVDRALWVAPRIVR